MLKSSSKNVSLTQASTASYCVQRIFHSFLLTPHIGLDGEFVIGQTFRCGPFNGKLGSSMSCVGVSRHQATQTKISHFNQVVFPN